jgi:hypothetical protein
MFSAQKAANLGWFPRFGFLRKHGYPDHFLTAPFTPTLRDGPI